MAKRKSRIQIGKTITVKGKNTESLQEQPKVRNIKLYHSMEQKE